MKSWNIVFGAALCAGTAFFNAAQAQAVSFDNSDASKVEFPKMEDAWLKKGAIMDPMHPRSMGLGLNKNQVRSIIQYPHFSEGLFGPTQWDYIFNFKKPDGSYLTCQYQVHFEDGLTKGLYWDREECLKFVNAKPAAPAPVVNASHPITLSSDGLFAFGKSGWNDLQVGGRENLATLAGQIKNGFSQLRSVDIVGHTDRIGSVQSNMALSIARANTVRQYLISQGIDGKLIRAHGVGSSQPVVFCEGRATPSVIACLMPNRRIELSVNGDK